MAVTVELAQDLEGEIKEAGLLAPDIVEAVFREQLRRFHLGELLKEAREMAAHTISAMTTEEIQKEVDAVRARRRAQMRAAADWLPGALRELDEIDEEIEEDGLPPVSEIARAHARRVLLALSSQPLAPNVYPTGDGEISLSFKAPDGSMTFHLLLDNKGEAAWISAGEGQNSFGRHMNAADLPIDFVMERLRALRAALGDS